LDLGPKERRAIGFAEERKVGFLTAFKSFGAAPLQLREPSDGADPFPATKMVARLPSVEDVCF
jgi:hypothetical protein